MSVCVSLEFIKPPFGKRRKGSWTNDDDLHGLQVKVKRLSAGKKSICQSIYRLVRELTGQSSIQHLLYPYW